MDYNYSLFGTKEYILLTTRNYLVFIVGNAVGVQGFLDILGKVQLKCPFLAMRPQ
jgi:hypothetical protein